MKHTWRVFRCWVRGRHARVRITEVIPYAGYVTKHVDFDICIACDRAWKVDERILVG